MASIYITFREILEDPVFDEAKVLCGARGLGNIVERISVFDCTIDDQLIADKVLKKGDLFISCLEQFTPYANQTAEDFFHMIIDQESAGLFIIGEKGLHNLTEEVKDLCEAKNFPVVYIRIDMPYALIMDTVNQYISFENTNALNTMKIDRILYSLEERSEDLNILTSIKSTVESYLTVSYVSGDFSIGQSRINLYRRYLNYKKDIYISCGDDQLFIFSDESEQKLQVRSRIMSEEIEQTINNAYIGQSRIYTRKDIRKALEEARKTLVAAKSLNIQHQIYDPLSTFQLLSVMRDSHGAHDFYESYNNAIAAKVSTDNLVEYHRTIETWVAQKGDYKRTAELMNQHENTIRYRVNRVKEALGMEHDPIRFHETIAIAVKLRILIGAELTGLE